MTRPNWSPEHAADLQARREAAGYSRRGLSKAIGCRLATVASWETGTHGPGPVNVARIEQALTTAPPPPRMSMPTSTRWALAHRFDGGRLRTARQAAGYSVAGLAERLGVDYPHVWRWENNKLTPSPGYVEKLCSTLSIDPKDLLKPADASQADQPS